MATRTSSPQLDASAHAGHHGRFLRHLVEMTLIMIPGMLLGAVVFTIGAGVAAGSSLTWDEARLRYPEVCLLTIGVIMSAPMAAWMRHRGHSWERGGGMTAAMVAPALALIGLFWLHVIGNDPLCGVYCLLMFPAMVAAMLVRRDEYGGFHLPASVGG